MRRFGLAWQIGTGFGWGVLGTQLVLAACRRGLEPALFEDPGPLRVDPLEGRVLGPVVAHRADVRRQVEKHGDGPIRAAMPLVHARGNDSSPAFGRTSLRLRGTSNHGLIFFEDTRFSPRALAELRAFDTVVAGSSWNARILESRGLTNVRTCLQGIDPAVFHPAPRRGLFGDRFVIFSGGKLEYRKAQDAVVAAFKAFRERHPDALLIAAWTNAWPRSTGVLQLGRHGMLGSCPGLDGEGRLDIGKWLVDAGLPPDSFVLIGDTPNKDMAGIVREADVALFPNRCEGGTNLVAMEAIACGVPTLLSANTGHLDLIDLVGATPLSRQGVPAAVAGNDPDGGMDGWGEPSVEEMVEALETVRRQRDEARRQALRSAAAMQSLAWNVQAGRILETVGLLPPSDSQPRPDPVPDPAPPSAPVPAAPVQAAPVQAVSVQADSVQADSGPGSVARIYVATPCYGGLVTQECLVSLFAAERALAPRGIRLDVYTRGNDALVTRARNALVADFLSKPEYTHLFFLDADLQFDPAAVERLVAFGADVAGGIYPLKTIDWNNVRQKAMQGVADLEAASLGYVCELDGTRNVTVDRGFCRVKSVGNGFMMIRRHVFTRLAEANPQWKCRVTHGAGAADRLDGHYYAFFDTEIDPETGEYMPEDWVFCKRCRAAGFDIWADLSSKLVHVGQFRFRGDFTTQFRVDS